MKSGIERIAEERQKQIEKHGRDAEHDKGYENDILSTVAAQLAIRVPDNWKLLDRHPDRIEQLTIAGALLAAEIDRLQLVAAAPTPANQLI